MDEQAYTCVKVEAGELYQGKQSADFNYFAGISAESAGSQMICMHMLAIPPGGRAGAHLHEGHETAIYVLQGEAGMYFGQKLEEHVTLKPGDFLFIPAGMPHLPYNLSETDPCRAILARTDPNEQESVVLRPDLEEKLGINH